MDRSLSSTRSCATTQGRVRQRWCLFWDVREERVMVIPPADAWLPSWSGGRGPEAPWSPVSYRLNGNPPQQRSTALLLRFSIHPSLLVPAAFHFFTDSFLCFPSLSKNKAFLPAYCNNLVFFFFYCDNQKASAKQMWFEWLNTKPELLREKWIYQYSWSNLNIDFATIW